MNEQPIGEPKVIWEQGGEYAFAREIMEPYLRRSLIATRVEGGTLYESRVEWQGAYGYEARSALAFAPDAAGSPMPWLTR